MIASARQRGIRLGEQPAVPRMSDLSHLYAASLGKLELDMMGTHQMSERQVFEAIVAEAVGAVFEEYVDDYGLEEISEIFGQGVRIEVGDMLPSSAYAERLQRVPPVWDEGVRGQRGGESRPSAPRASSSSSRACTPRIASHAPNVTASSSTKL